MMTAKEYWDRRYKMGGNSGDGSYGEQLNKKLNWLANLDIDSILDIGCGDFNFGSNLLKAYPLASYLGYDFSKEIIKKNREKYPLYKFTSKTDKVLHGDLVLCLDVLFHILNDDELEAALKSLENYPKYLAITGYEYDSPLDTHVHHRKLDYKRFGTPIIREIVEESGELYFYLFKKPTLDLSKVTACLITKDDIYPKEVLENVAKYPFGEVLVLTGSDSPYRKYELFKKAKYKTLYYSDDDALVPIDKLIEAYKPSMINLGMKRAHFEQYADKRYSMGLGWGAFFDKSILDTLGRYTKVYGEDALFKRETERILTYLNFPQNRIVLTIQDLPAAYAPDRLYRQPEHYENIQIVEDRCKLLI